mmetsp:Transcript_23900/g.73178  ORF Transcript_23900/g.73178 Transcript_23900/m.73178 type:complete len:295 (+) Transcript_23900:829-1713(+)|eukprot:scaffold216525_cov25-Tisochrysis_lutea.AAC.2
MRKERVASADDGVQPNEEAHVAHARTVGRRGQQPHDGGDDNRGGEEAAREDSRLEHCLRRVPRLVGKQEDRVEEARRGHRAQRQVRRPSAPSQPEHTRADQHGWHEWHHRGAVQVRYRRGEGERVDRGERGDVGGLDDDDPFDLPKQQGHERPLVRLHAHRPHPPLQPHDHHARAPEAPARKTAAHHRLQAQQRAGLGGGELNGEPADLRGDHLALRLQRVQHLFAPQRVWPRVDEPLHDRAPPVAAARGAREARAGGCAEGRVARAHVGERHNDHAPLALARRRGAVLRCDGG